MKKWVKILLWIIGVLAGIIVVVALIVSPIAKSYVNNHSEELVGRKVHIDGLRVNILSGRVVIRDLNLYEDNGTDVFVRFDTLDVKASLPKLLGSTVHIKHITLAGLNANLVQQGETFNFQSIIDHFASDEPQEEEEEEPSEWVLKFYNIRISHAQIHYHDVTNGKQWHLPDINLRVPGFVMGGEEQSEGGLNIGFAEGGHLNIDGNYDSRSNKYNLTAALDDFALNNITPLVTDFMNIDQIGGHLEAQLKAEGDISEIMKSRIGGTLALNNTDLRNGNTSYASLNQLLVKINNINLDENRYEIGSVKLDGLTARYEQWPDHSTIDNLLVPEKSDQSDQSDLSDKSSQPLRLTVGQLAITDCALTYDDHTLPDDFHFPITKLGIEATNVTLAGGNNAKLHATLPGGGHLMVIWNGDLDNWKRHQDLLLSVKGLDMKQLSPWAVAYTGQPIEDGVFGLTTRLKINNSILDNQNKIDIFKAKVGSRRKDVEPEMKIPLKTALYILKDKDDKILIDMPIQGDVDSPEFNYMKLVWKTLGNLLVKVATSPARALGNAMGLGKDNLEFIAMAPNQHGLTSEQYHILSELATIAKSDSLLMLTLVQRMPEAATDSVAQGYKFRNEIIRRYLAEQGVRPMQVSVSTGEPTAEGEQTGYAITSEMKLE
jgi:uncharacterized protein involved in outer membrane biogenesis